jgi:hypothetical protein
VVNSLWVHQYNGQLIFCDVFHHKDLHVLLGSVM